MARRAPATATCARCCRTTCADRRWPTRVGALDSRTRPLAQRTAVSEVPSPRISLKRPRRSGRHPQPKPQKPQATRHDHRCRLDKRVLITPIAGPVWRAPAATPTANGMAGSGSVGLSSDLPDEPGQHGRPRQPSSRHASLRGRSASSSGGRDRDRPQLPGRVQAGELERVALIGLGVITGLPRNRARRAHGHLDPCGPCRTGQSEPGRPGLIDRADLSGQV
jgi:hypothetical protein